MKFEDLVDELAQAEAARLIAAATTDAQAEADEIRAVADARAAHAIATYEATLTEALAQINSHPDAVHVIREHQGRGAAPWVAAHEGKAVSTARRWLSAHPPASRVAAVIELARLLVRRDLDAEFESAQAARELDTEQQIAATIADAIAQAEALAQAAGPALAAQALRGKTSASIGASIPVAYDGETDGTRDIHDADIDGDVLADLLEAGDLDGATDEFTAQIMADYGDLADTLDITDFPNGITLS
ncbi:hypothetical protein [Lentzea sp. CA-135723]|uniref:hypothetical protein n=1 Tax=Lentzea sp. CA-135723 TaxID=3239950 RepID=UPI003D8E453D